MTNFRGYRTALIGVTALSALAGPPALAQQASSDATQTDAQSLNAIQKQIQQLQRQLQKMQKEAAQRDAQVKAAQAQAAAAQAQAAHAQQTAEHPPTVNPFPAPPPGGQGILNGSVTSVAPPPGSESLAGPSPALLTQTGPGYSLVVGGLTITLGGYVEELGVWRNHNEVADIGSSFNTGIPFKNNPLYYMNEYRQSAHQSRVSALIQGNPDPLTDVAAYMEVDFLGAATTANSVESNSYNPRMRQFYATIDRSDMGLHVLFGQAWSMLTMFKDGIIPRQELIPVVPEADYVVGYNWTRNAQLRVAKDFDNEKYWLGLSVESPEVQYYVGPNGTGTPGSTVTYQRPGGTLLNPLANYSLDSVPDVILKAAADPGYGHYEVYGLGRMFQDRVSQVGAGQTDLVPAGGVGAGAVVPIYYGGHDVLDLQLSGLAGDGIGRYGAALLPDATIGRNGAPMPVPEVEALFGAIGHPLRSLDIYSYIGTEQESASSFSLAGKGYGYGSPLYSNSGCNIELSSLPCVGNTSAVTQLNFGAWWTFLKSDGVGTFLIGPQYSHTIRQTFKGPGGAPAPVEDMFFLSFRYYPFL